MQFIDRPTKKISRGVNSMTYIMWHHTWDKANARDVSVINYVVYNPVKISYHYLIDKVGIIYKIAEDNDITRHAGSGSLNWIRNTMNQHAIGIAVISDGYNFTDAQKKSYKELVEYLMGMYSIRKENVIRHADYSGDKRDLAPWFFDEWVEARKKWLRGKKFYTNVELNRARAALNNNSRLRHETKNPVLKKQLNDTNNIIRSLYLIK